MSDDIDRAADLEELQRTIALSARKMKAPEALGYCMNCYETLPPPDRWCDLDCRTDWEMIERRKTGR